MIAGIVVILARTSEAEVPAPPVNQTIGMFDALLGDFTEAECRACHAVGVPDRHHVLYGEPIPPGSLVPDPDADRDGNPDLFYGCFNCHDTSFNVVRDCVACHTSSPHHMTPQAQAGDCVYCHGEIVDNFNDGHYIPTYDESMVTPSANGGCGLPLNSRGNGAGACDYCHDDDGGSTPVILNTSVLHHSQGFDCGMCHLLHGALPIRECERCHGPDSLHSIQADSPNPANLGTIVVGGEDPGYGHVGRDAGPGDSDCWGCHGFASSSSVPEIGPLIPTLYNSDLAVIKAGTDTTVVLNGVAFTDSAGSTAHESDVRLTADDGFSFTLEPDVIINSGKLAVTIPEATPPGNYKIQAVKGATASNPAVISVLPEVKIANATSDGTVTIRGSGFGGWAEGSGTSVTSKVKSTSDRFTTTTVVTAAIVSWSDTKIVADFGATSVNGVTVNSVFGSAAADVQELPALDADPPAGGDGTRGGAGTSGDAGSGGKGGPGTNPRRGSGVRWGFGKGSGLSSDSGSVSDGSSGSGGDRPKSRMRRW